MDAVDAWKRERWTKDRFVTNCQSWNTLNTFLLFTQMTVIRKLFNRNLSTKLHTETRRVRNAFYEEAKIISCGSDHAKTFTVKMLS